MNVLIAWAVAGSLAGPPSAPSFEAVARQAHDARVATRLDEAAALYRRAVDLRPEWDEGWWHLGALAYERQGWAEARDAFSRFLALKPEAGPGWALRGISAFHLRDYDAALRDLHKAETLGGANEEIARAARFHLALALARAGEFESALSPLVRLARTEPESPALAEATGLALLRLPYLPSEVPEDKRELVRLAGAAGFAALARRPDEARTRFRALVERFPAAPNVHYAYGLFLLREGSDEGLTELRREIEVQPDSVYARLEIAFELLRRGEAAAAQPVAAEAVRLAPGLFAARNALGRALLETGEVEPAIRELEEAVRLAPEAPEMYFALARAYVRAGREADAEQARATFKDLDRRRRQQRGEPVPEARP